MNFTKVMLSVGVMAMLSGPVMALEVVNEDDKPYKVLVVQGEQTAEITVESKGVVEDICNDGCTLQLEDGSQIKVKGSETVSIDDGGFAIADE